MLNRSASVYETLDSQKPALIALRDLEAELILLLELPEEKRSRILGLLAHVRDEFQSSFRGGLQRTGSRRGVGAAATTPPQSSPAGFVAAAASGVVGPLSSRAVQPPAPPTSGSSNTLQSTTGGGPRPSRRRPTLNHAETSLHPQQLPEAILPPHLQHATESFSTIEHATSIAIGGNEVSSYHGGDSGVGGSSQQPLEATSVVLVQENGNANEVDFIQRVASSVGSVTGGGGGGGGGGRSVPALTSSVTATTPHAHINATPAAMAANHISVPHALVSPNFGTCLSSALHFILEGLLVACEADRLTLYSRSQSVGGALQLALNVGANVPPAKKGVNASSVGLIQAVFTTQIAANLDVVTFEDVSECPGPTKAKNALFFPVVHVPVDGGKREVVGVVGLINKRRGSVPFTAADEHILHVRLPAVGYVLQHYPMDYNVFPFDAAPIHRLIPLHTWSPPLLVLPQSMAIAPYVQRVFHRNGAERYIRRQALTTTEDTVPLQSSSEMLVTVETYINVLEDCWKRGIADRIEVELALRQKMQHLTDAREILIRKQKKYDILKETLCEQLESTIHEGRGGGGGGGFGSGRRGGSFR